ncbi:type II toxin-antitoxin system VapC family toxin [Methylobacterium brachiatum]|uniref:type II toxin-antitoxin system VapC family toxin n=1 Tax=Methylobacterium brachiatum TaxID=269660 RepID=UPI000EFC9925|nr:type II toxin-antitoxin system VapC family toxin [Methylobacterium brachiatum]AYO85465.1 type II toxin-antitoxin system VapC family toxin [Methylobacterium brachiatum]
MKPRYMLDTTICIYIRRARPPQVLERFRDLTPGDVVMSPITQGELLFGLEKIRTTTGFDAALRGFTKLVELIPVVALGETVSAHYAAFRAKLQTAGLIIGNNDLWIAAHAKALDVTLVTNNTREFDRLKPALSVENWADEAAGFAP